MKLTLDECYEYVSYANCPSRCHLRVYQPEQEDSGIPVVIATQYRDNPGTSITNAAEDIASAVWNRLGCPPTMVWLENYEHAGLERNSLARMKSEFDRVEFDFVPGPDLKLANPRWKAVSREEVETLVGQPVASVQRPTALISEAA